LGRQKQEKKYIGRRRRAPRDVEEGVEHYGEKKRTADVPQWVLRLEEKSSTYAFESEGNRNPIYSQIRKRLVISTDSEVEGALSHKRKKVKKEIPSEKDR